AAGGSAVMGIGAGAGSVPGSGAVLGPREAARTTAVASAAAAATRARKRAREGRETLVVIMLSPALNDAAAISVPVTLDPSYFSLMDPLDTLGRPLHDLRISVTDRCNFRCV